MIFIPGQTIVVRHVTDEHLEMTQACRVISEDERGLLLRVLAGAGPTTVSLPAIRRQDDMLILIPPGAAYSIWWLFTDVTFTGWLVNLESPSTRWGAYGVGGIDILHHGLAITVSPDRTWQKKGVGSFEGNQGGWHQGVVDAIEAGRFPFDGTWCDRSALVPKSRIPATIAAWLHRHGSTSQAA